MDHEEMRLKCLEMAQEQGHPDPVAYAEYLFNFAKYGKAEADRIANDEQRLNAEIARMRAREAREQADPNVVAETDKATIYKQPPFKDYKPE